MKHMRLLAVLVLMGPMMSIASDACCAPESGHQEAHIDACGVQTHLEAGADKCCHTDACAECLACHLQSFSPSNSAKTRTHVSTPHESVFGQPMFTEVVSAVLTPPPTF